MVTEKTDCQFSAFLLSLKFYSTIGSWSGLSFTSEASLISLSYRELATQSFKTVNICGGGWINGPLI